MASFMSKVFGIHNYNYEERKAAIRDDLTDGDHKFCYSSDDSDYDDYDYDYDYDYEDGDKDKDEIEENTNQFIEVDGFILKIADPQFYASFLVFHYYCRLLCGLESSRVLRDNVGEELDPRDEFQRDLAITAVDKYNQHRKKPKLKFVELLKANRCIGASTYNLTILAENGDNGRIGTYQAALLQHDNNGEYFLGLLVDQDADDELLAIVSLTGAAAAADIRNLRKILGDGKGAKCE